MNEPTSVAGRPGLDDRRWALLAYLFTPIVPLMLIVMDQATQRAFLKQHVWQALALGVVQGTLLILAPFTACLSMLAFALLYVAIIYWATRAYNGETFEIPLATKYLRDQGWL